MKDEVHEREQFTDFLLAFIRLSLPAHPHLRLVLMSATLADQTELFNRYFDSPAFIHSSPLSFHH